jgi:hypothetical protein
MGILPFVVFWILLFLGRDELGLKAVCICIAVWMILLICFMMLGISPYIFIALQSLFDIVLLIMVFGGDIKIS